MRPSRLETRRLGLFRTQVVGGSHYQAVLGDPASVARFISGIGNAEIGQQGAAAVPEDVFRFDVPMNRTHRVGVAQRLGQIGSDADDFVDRERPFLIEPLPQGLAVDERHDVVKRVADLARVEQGNQIGMDQTGGEVNLPAEALGAESRRDLGAQDLDRDRPIQPGIVGQQHGSHTPATKLLLHIEAVLEGSANIDWRPCHGRLRYSPPRTCGTSDQTTPPP